MKILSPTAHGFIDVAFITVLAMAPIMFDLEPAVDTACFVLAGGYLLITLLTDFKLGIFRVIPFPVHGWLDLLTGLALLAAPFLFHFESGSAERNLSWLLGVVSVVTWFITDWKGQTRSLMTDRG
ncbi:hypothetical protein HNQ93_000629 [Hymenobacter luteus]|uniref:SPW repeat-containing integral membrane domain-containing protein n=2 Tax=Hymenobacter TaxID=89966 RepID=A0A7W9SZH3_9BACT|nr:MULTISPECIES: hypothetical protein [Hymenobacter]MBB4599891.1 hypothetical protein [Hymenobacter latericoloratus]MBB6057799.1 hypothetical protein [Hymenobacter luteus]